jgi:hypothetical protein
MTLEEIRQMPTTYQDSSRGPCHESLLRSFHIVNKVSELLAHNTPAPVIQEIINDLLSAKDPD